MWRRLRGRKDPIILMYHRVADVAVDPWELAVAPTRFAEQMGVRSYLVQIVVSAAALGEPGMSLVRRHLPAALVASRELGLERYRPRVEELLLSGLAFSSTPEREYRT